jgi:serine/threonine protein kinase
VADAIFAIRESAVFRDFEHRDIKPANLLGGDESVIRLCDFNSAPTGLSRQGTGQNIHRARLALTEDYCAPEVWRDPLTPPPEGGLSDVYSIGKILEELLAFRKEPRIHTAIADFDAAMADYVRTRREEPHEFDVNGNLARMTTHRLNHRSGLGQTRLWTEDYARLLRCFLADLCQAEIAVARSNPTADRIQETLEVLAVAFGQQSASIRLRLPECHRCKKGTPPLVQKLTKFIRDEVPTLRNPISGRHGMALIETVSQCLHHCPGLLDLVDWQKACWRVHEDFSETNQEWMTRWFRVSLAAPDCSGPVARYVLNWIGNNIQPKGERP